MSAASRKELLDQIGALLTENDLAVSSRNLAFAHAALSGENNRLAQKLCAREIASKPITQAWIDEVLRSDEMLVNQVRDIEQLMDTFERLMERFALTADSACAATAGYGDAIGRQFAELERAGEYPDTSPLLRISEAMFERLRQIEDAMQESVAETNQIRKTLASARREAEMDHLTGLPNRRAFERRYENARQEARQSGKPLSVAFCDIDHFKRFNDTYGHDAGDRVLRAVATKMREATNEDFFVARHGGEEFALLFPDCSQEDAWCKLESVRRVLAGYRIRNRGGEDDFPRITFSAGIAEVEEKEDGRGALSRADRALYRAKEEGRNRVLVASADMAG